MQRTSPASTGLDGARHLRAAHYLYPRVLRHGSIFRLTFFLSFHPIFSLFTLKNKNG